MEKLTLLEKDYNRFLENFDRFSIILWIIPILVAFWKIKNLNYPLRIYLYYSLTIFSLHILEHVHIWAVMKYDPYWEFMKSLKINDTTFFVIFFRLTVYYFIGRFYKQILQKKTSSIVYKISWVCFISSIFIYWFVDGYNKYGFVNPILVRLFLIVIPITFLSEIYSNRPNITLWKNPYFLISQSLIISNVLSLLFALIAESIHYTNFVLYAQLSIVRNIVSIFTDLLVAYAFYQARNVKFMK